jgi:hypothetical protein
MVAMTRFGKGILMETILFFQEVTPLVFSPLSEEPNATGAGCSRVKNLQTLVI